MARPLKLSKQLFMRIAPEQLGRLDQWCLSAKMKRSDAVRLAIEQLMQTRPMPIELSKNLNMRIEPEQLGRLDQWCLSAKMKRTDAVRLAIEQLTQTRSMPISESKDAAGDDALEVLWAKWRAVSGEKVPEGLEGEMSDLYLDGAGKQTAALEQQIMMATAETVLGAYAQITVLRDWVENGMPAAGKSIVKDFHNKIESALEYAVAKASVAEPERLTDDT